MPTSVLTGGGLRSLQIAEVVNNLSIPWLDLSSRRDKRILHDTLGGWRLRFTVPGATDMTARMCRRVANRLVALEHLAAQVGYPRCLLWENTKDHSLLLFGRRHGIPVVALPHNVESLGSREQLRYAQGNIRTRFHREVSLLSLARNVLVISTWDKWLLSLFGVDSEYLPYRPPYSRRQALQSIRSHRKDSPAASGPMIVVGTANYAPNRKGMKTLLSALGGIAKKADFRVVVAGFGTDALRDGLPSRIEVRGALSEEAMFSLYKEARAGVVYQQPATGALTRIPDLLTAGVPVYANTYAARSYPCQPGLSVFEDFDMLAAQIEKDYSGDVFASMPMPDQRPEALEASLQAVIRECIEEHSA